MKKLIIIGGGITGLSTGIFALQKGYKVTILEKNDFAGGCATGWFKNEYYIDNCMHWLTGTNQTTKTFKLWKTVGALDETSNLYQPAYFYKSTDDSGEISLYPDLDKFRLELIKISRGDLKEINKLVIAIKEMMKLNINDNFFSNLYNKTFVVPKVFLKYKNMTLEDLAKTFKHPLIQKMITDYFPKNYSSLAFIYAYATFASGNGKVYTNGTRAFSYNILNKFLALGGEIIYNSEVTNINLTNNTVDSIIVNNKDAHKADIFIYTADAKHLFTDLLDESYMPKRLKHKFSNLKENDIYSSFHTAFIVDKIFCPINESIVIDIPTTKVGNTSINRLFIKNYSYLYNNRNKTIIQVFVPQNINDYNFWKNLNTENLEKYNEEKNNVAKTLESHILNHFTILIDNMKLIDAWTPYTYNQYYNSYCGSYMGFVAKNKLKLIKPANKIKKIKNLYLASYWQNTTGGLPVALENAKEVSRLL